MKNLILLLTILSLTGCTHYKWCAKHAQLKDSVVYIEKIQLDTAKIFIPGDTTVLLMPIDCPDQVINNENAKQKIKIVFKDRLMRVETICKDDSLEKVITTLQKTSSEKKTIVKEVKYTPWYNSFKFGAAVCFVVLVGLWLVKKFYL